MLAILLPSVGGYTGSSYRYGSNARQIALSNSLISKYDERSKFKVELKLKSIKFEKSM